MKQETFLILMAVLVVLSLLMLFDLRCNLEGLKIGKLGEKLKIGRLGEKMAVDGDDERNLMRFGDPMFEAGGLGIARKSDLRKPWL